jgi:preprotein translocase subunit SecA
VGGQSPVGEFLKIVDSEFLKLEHKIEEAIPKNFCSLTISEAGIDLDKQGIRGPSSTWTYLITDNQFGLWVGLLQGSNIGFTSVAAGVYGPLYILLALIQRFFRKRRV